MSQGSNEHFNEERLSAYLEGDLSPEETDTLLAHLDQCQPCTEKLTELEDARQLFEKLPRQTTRGDFQEKLETRIRRRSRGRFFGQGWQSSNKVTYLGAAIVLVILAALMFMSETTLEIRDDATGLTGEELGRQNPPGVPAVPDYDVGDGSGEGSGEGTGQY